jgi:hypothetical protein
MANWSAIFVKLEEAFGRSTSNAASARATATTVRTPNDSQGLERRMSRMPGHRGSSEAAFVTNPSRRVTIGRGSDCTQNKY